MENPRTYDSYCERFYSYCSGKYDRKRTYYEDIIKKYIASEDVCNLIGSFVRHKKCKVYTATSVPSVKLLKRRNIERGDIVYIDGSYLIFTG